MPAKDLYYNTVKTALIKDDWAITEPFPLKVGKRDLLIDLGAEKLLIAVYNTFFQEAIVQIVLKRRHLNLLIFDETQEAILQWIP